MVTCPYEWKILKWDEKSQTKKQYTLYMIVRASLVYLNNYKDKKKTHIILEIM